MEREAALDRVVSILDDIESDPMPVPLREIWVYGDVALGLNPVDRLDVYLTKDLLMDDDQEAAASFRESHGVRGVGGSVSAVWAESFPDLVRTNDAGYAAPARCLAAHLLRADDPVHLEVCNASFDDNVTRRLEAALAREAYDDVLDPRGVRIWADGVRADDRIDRLRDGELPFPTLPEALSMLGVDSDRAASIAATVREQKRDPEGASVRSEVV